MREIGTFPTLWQIQDYIYYANYKMTPHLDLNNNNNLLNNHTSNIVVEHSYKY